MNVNIAVFDHDEVLLAYLSGVVLACLVRRRACLLGSSDFACALSTIDGILAALVQLLLQQMLLIDELSILLTRAGGESAHNILLASATAYPDLSTMTFIFDLIRLL